MFSVIALSKLYDLNDPLIAQTQVKGDLIVPTSDRIMTRSRAKQSTHPSSYHAHTPLVPLPITDFFTVPVKDPDQYTIIPAPLKILKLLIEELTSAQGKSGAASLEVGGSAAAIAAAEAVGKDGIDKETAEGGSGGGGGGDDDDDGSDSGWEDETDDLLDLSLGATKSDLFSYLDGGAGSRMRDDETQAYLTEFFLRAARENTDMFKGWYNQLTPVEQQKLNELAQL